MSVVARLGAFAVALVLVFGAAYAIGGTVDPIGQGETPAESLEPDQERPSDDHRGHP